MSCLYPVDAGTRLEMKEALRSTLGERKTRVPAIFVMLRWCRCPAPCYAFLPTAIFVEEPLKSAVDNIFGSNSAAPPLSSLRFKEEPTVLFNRDKAFDIFVLKIHH
jgi:hypothetical protein